MATNLFTYVERQPVLSGQDVYRVYFYFNHGIDNDSSVKAIDIDVSEAREDKFKLAELLAIKYICIHTRYLGVDRDGAKLVLHTSNGSIKKLQKKSTQNTDLIHHGRFLQYRFSEATIKTERNFKWIEQFKDKGDVERLTIADCSEKAIPSSVGELYLTYHAVERYMQRMNIAGLGTAWRRLSSLLSCNDSNVNWSIKREAKKMIKSGVDRTSETWTITKGRAKLVDVVIVRTDENSRVITVMA